MCVCECVHRHVQMYVCIRYVHVVIYETATHLIFDLDFGPTFLCVCVLSWDFFCCILLISFLLIQTLIHKCTHQDLCS